MKRGIVIAGLLLLLAIALRVAGPYVSSIEHRAERQARRQAMSLLLDSVYGYARTNAGRFPDSLADLNAKSLPGIDLQRFVYRRPKDPVDERTDGTKIILAERALSFSNAPTLFLGVQGNWVIMKSRADYSLLMKQNNMED